MASRAAAAAALLLLYCGTTVVGAEYTSQSLSTFVDTMLAEYDREVPPQPRTAVALALDVRHATVDDDTATMCVLADLKMRWNDTRLTWDAKTWEGDSVVVPLERVWSPDVALVNGASSAGGSGGSGLRARLGAAGALSAALRLDLRVPVALQLDAWPRDQQQAVFKFASRAHNQDEVDLYVSDYTNLLLLESGEWKVLSVKGVTMSWSRGEDGAERAGAWTVKLERRGAAQAAAAGAVLAAAVLVLGAALALPYSQRPPLAACAAFLAALWLVTAVWHVPGGVSAPRVVRVMCAACACAAACGACAVVAARLARSGAAPPPALRALLTRVSHLYPLAPDPESMSSSKSGAWAAAAQLFDAVVVAAVLVTLVVLVGVHVLS